MIRKLESYIKKRRCTILGVGPMSKNCVDAVIELANEYAIPILLIASRRQIDAEDLGCGYVNSWSTERFAQYVIDHDKTGNVILSRDHGGPWQNDREAEQKLSFRHAMDSAKRSFEVDINSGFEVIHIDPSKDIFKDPHIDEVLQRVFELYEFCYSIAKKNNRNISFEIGTDEQKEKVQDLEELEYVIAEMMKFCQKNRFPRPLFVVAQTGTKVMEMKNVGSLDSSLRIENELPAEIQVPRIVGLCNNYGIFLKEHNADYLSEETLRWHTKLGIHAANVAPEFGVAETKAFIEILNENDLKNISEEFIQIAYKSGKWEKWVLKDTETSDYEKGIIAGHYLFTDKDVIELKEKAKIGLQKHGIDLDKYLKNKVKERIFSYIKYFNLLRRWL